MNWHKKRQHIYKTHTLKTRLKVVYVLQKCYDDADVPSTFLKPVCQYSIRSTTIMFIR